MFESDDLGIDVTPELTAEAEYARLVASLDQVPMGLAARREARAAIDAYIQVCRFTALEDADLAIIRHAARHRSRRVAEFGMEILILLFHKHPEIAAEWRALAESTRAEQRRLAVACLADYRVPYEFAASVLQNAVYDKSSIVRKFAIASARSRKATDILGELRASGHLPSLLDSKSY